MALPRASLTAWNGLMVRQSSAGHFRGRDATKSSIRKIARPKIVVSPGVQRTFGAKPTRTPLTGAPEASRTCTVQAAAACILISAGTGFPGSNSKCCGMLCMPLNSVSGKPAEVYPSQRTTASNRPGGRDSKTNVPSAATARQEFQSIQFASLSGAVA